MTEGPRFEGALRELRGMIADGGKTPPPTPPPGLGREDDPEMEARVKRLEEDVKIIGADIKVLIGDVREMKGQVGTLERAVVSKIPTGWSFFAIIVSAVGLTLAAIPALPALSRMLGAH